MWTTSSLNNSWGYGPGFPQGAPVIPNGPGGDAAFISTAINGSDQNLVIQFLDLIDNNQTTPNDLTNFLENNFDELQPYFPDCLLDEIYHQHIGVEMYQYNNVPNNYNNPIEYIHFVDEDGFIWYVVEVVLA